MKEDTKNTIKGVTLIIVIGIVVGGCLALLTVSTDARGRGSVISKWECQKCGDVAVSRYMYRNAVRCYHKMSWDFKWCEKCTYEALKEALEEGHRRYMEKEIEAFLEQKK